MKYVPGNFRLYMIQRYSRDFRMKPSKFYKKILPRKKIVNYETETVSVVKFNL